MRRIRTIVRLLLALTVLASTGVALAGDDAPKTAPQSDGPTIAAVEVGIAGAYKAGHWMPVRVTLNEAAEADARIALIAADSDGTPVEYTVDVGGRAEATLYAKIGRTRGRITVRLHEGDRIVQEKTINASESPIPSGEQRGGDEKGAASTTFPAAVGANRSIILSIGGGQDAVAAALRTLRGPADQQPYLVALDAGSDLPDKWCGYEAVDIVVLGATDKEALASLDADDPRVKALDEWTRLGGQVVVCVGAEAEEILTNAKSPLARFAPGPFDRSVTVRRAAAIEMFTEGDTPLTLDGSSKAPWLSVPLFAEPSGVVELTDGVVPLIIRTPRDFGQVVFFGGDLDAAPIAEWKDRGRFVAKLIGLESASREEEEASRKIVQLGYSDMAGQLRSGLDRFDDVRVVPFSLVMILVVVYIALIGPADYYLVHHVLKRPVLTWITFPVSIVVFCIVAAVVALSFKSSDVQANKVDLVDVDVESGRVRGSSWANIYSPDASRRDIAFEPEFLVASDGPTPASLTSWLGLTGNALGGMDATTLEAPVWSEPYAESADLDRLERVPMLVRSTKSFTSRWTARADRLPESELSEMSGAVSGQVMNTLDVPLHDCLLVHDRWAYVLGDVPPGSVAFIDNKVTRFDLNTLLTNPDLDFARLQRPSERKAKTYERTSTDLDYILRAMMFYRAAGGRYHTRLAHHHQAFIDMSDLLKTGRAVFVARIDASEETSSEGARLRLTMTDGEDVTADGRRMTMCRFVLPVASEDSQRD